VSILISFFGKAGMPDQAESIFDRLRKRSQNTTCDDIGKYRPDAVSYASLLHAYAVAGMASKVGNLFQQMQRDGPQPTIHAYNDVLLAYSKSDHPSAAEEFLQWWNEEDRHGPIRPDVRSYNIVLHSLAKAAAAARGNTRSSNDGIRNLGSVHPSAVERAQRLFDNMPRRDRISYSTLVSALAMIPGRASLEAIDSTVGRAWRDGYIRVDADFISNILYSVAQSDDTRNIPTYAERIVRDMIVRGVPASVDVYNALIYCWSRSGDRDAPRRAVEILSELETSERLGPDVKTYANVAVPLQVPRPEGGRDCGEHCEEDGRSGIAEDAASQCPGVHDANPELRPLAPARQGHPGNERLAKDEGFCQYGVFECHCSSHSAQYRFVQCRSERVRAHEPERRSREGGGAESCMHRVRRDKDIVCTVGDGLARDVRLVFGGAGQPYAGDVKAADR